MIVLDSKSAMCIDINGKDNKHTRQIARIMIFLRNEEKCKIFNIYWCERGLQLEDIVTKNVGEPDLTPRMKNIMVRIDN